jgi:2-amino-4-hydroxy-6-hydroxymethyldihydropteridine diphosphokinase
MIPVYIGLGSNLDRPEHQVRTAISELSGLPQSRLAGTSSLYRSTPLGPQDQPDFINAVVKLETDLPAADLLEQLQRLENRHGRTRTEHWGPRTLDLDLLLYGEMIIDTDILSVPHPQMSQRGFVLEPLLEIEPSVTIPGVGSAREVYQRLAASPLQKLAAA